MLICRNVIYVHDENAEKRVSLKLCEKVYVCVT